MCEILEIGEDKYKMAEKKRIIWIDQLRGLAFYTVILGHMSIGTDLKIWLYSFHMPLFFMISGLNLNVEKIAKIKFSDFVLNLAKKMLVPYLWLQMFSFILRFIVSIIREDKQVPVLSFLKGILVGNNNIVGAPSNPLYYVLLLFLAQVGLWLVIRVSKGNKGVIGVILSLLSLVSIMLQKVDLPWHINVVPMAMLLVFVGRLLMDAYLFARDNIHRMNKLLYLTICSALFFAGYVLSRINGRISIHGNFYGRNFLLFLSCAVFTSVAIALVVMLLPESKALRFIGENTFFYMGVHKPLLLIFEALAGEYENHPVFLVVGSLVCFFGLMPVTWLFNKCVPYFCGKVTREETKLVATGKYLAVATVCAVPYLYFNNHFMDGILRESVGMMVLSAAAYIIAVVIAVLIMNKWLPFMFIQEKKKLK